MKKIFFIILCLMTLLLGISNATLKENLKPLEIKKLPFFIFSYRHFHSYYALSGYMGDILDVKFLKVLEPVFGKRCMKVVYKPVFKKTRLGWIGVYWQYPPNNWANNEKGGFNLSNAKYLFFYAKGAKGKENVEFKIGGIKGTYGDSDEITTGLISLTKEWTLYKIDLEDRNLKNIIGGFGVFMQAHLNPEGAILYLNDIYYSDKKEPGKSFFKDYAKSVRVEKNLIIEQSRDQITINISEVDQALYDLQNEKMKKSTYNLFENIADIVKQYNYKRVVINLKFYDSIHKEYDLDFSYKRAKEIQDFLIKMGIDRKKIGYKKYYMDPKVISRKKKYYTHGEKFNIMIVKWKEGEKDKFKDYYFTGMDAFIKGGYKLAVSEWKKALKIDPENDELKRKIKEAEEKMNR